MVPSPPVGAVRAPRSLATSASLLLLVMVSALAYRRGASVAPCPRLPRPRHHLGADLVLDARPEPPKSFDDGENPVRRELSGEPVEYTAEQGH